MELAEAALDGSKVDSNTSRHNTRIYRWTREDILDRFFAMYRRNGPILGTNGPLLVIS